jgi:excisionase family DNA binding protein
MADDVDLLADGALYTPAEVAELLNVSVDTVRKWREVGTGPAVTKLGPGKNSFVRYSRRDVAAWLHSHRTDSSTAAHTAVEAGPAPVEPPDAPGAGTPDDDTEDVA